jgi:hypothetical protein
MLYTFINNIPFFLFYKNQFYYFFFKILHLQDFFIIFLSLLKNENYKMCQTHITYLYVILIYLDFL